MINTSFGQQDTISILSWNVFLRPAIMNDHQMDRVDDITAFIEQQNCDVVVLQEVFHRKARKALIRSLKSKYNFHTKFGKTSFFGVPSGITILSKHPIKKSHFEYFKKSTGSDALAKKAVLKTRILIDSSYVDVYGTHLQAGGGEKRRKIRQEQLNVIRDFINSQDSTIDIIAGDFNISATTPAIDSVYEKLDVKLPELTGENLKTANFSNHNLMEASGKPKWIDFIFLRKDKRAKMIKTKILDTKQRNPKQESRISDHNPIMSKIVLH